jgi:TonB family protein
MDKEPVPEEPQAPPKHPPAQSVSVPILQRPRMVQWLRPAYPLEWAQTELEGTMRLGFQIDQTGATHGIEIERSSGSQKLDAAAVRAANAWRFAPTRWQGQPIESQATIEVRFNFFDYSVSHIDEEATTRAFKTTNRGTIHQDQSERVRQILEQIYSGKAEEGPPWPAAMHDWGPISGVHYLGIPGRPEWRRYSVNSKYRGAEHSVVIRWELFRVTHDSHEALWEIGMDRSGGVWALKAAVLDSSGRSNSTSACSGGISAD